MRTVDVGPAEPSTLLSSLCTLRSSRSHYQPAPLILSANASLLLLLFLVSVLSLPPPTASQNAPAIQNFVFYQLPNRRPVAHSTADQGELVLSRLRTRRSLQPLQTLGGFQPRVRPTREEEEERAGGPVYECTSLDGPECSFVRGEGGSDIVIKLLQNLAAQAREGRWENQQQQQQQSELEEPASLQQGGSEVLPTTDSGRSNSISPVPDDSADTVDDHANAPAAAQYTDDQLTVDDETATQQIDPAEDPNLTDEERAYFEELSTLSLSQLIMHRALQGDGQAADELGGLDGEELEYELMTVGEDGLEREMTVEEKEELRQQLLNGEVDIEMEDEEPYWDEQGQEYNETSGNYEYGEDEELVANGVH